MFQWSPFQSFQVIIKSQTKSSDEIEPCCATNKKNNLKDAFKAFSKALNISHDQDDDFYSTSFKEKLSDVTVAELPSSNSITTVHSSFSSKTKTKTVGFSDSFLQSHSDIDRTCRSSRSIKSLNYSQDSYCDIYPASLSSCPFDDIDDDDDDEHPFHQNINPLYSHNTSSKSLIFSNGHSISKFNSYDDKDIHEDDDEPVGNLNIPSTILTQLASKCIQQEDCVNAEDIYLNQDCVELQQLSG